MALTDDLIFAQDFRAGSGGTCLSLQGDVGTLSGATPPIWSADGLVFPGGANTDAWVDYGALPALQDLWLSAAPAAFTVFARVFLLDVVAPIAERNNGVDRGWSVNAFGGSKAQPGFTLGENAGRNAVYYYSSAGTGAPLSTWTNLGIVQPGNVGSVGAGSNAPMYLAGVPHTTDFNNAAGFGGVGLTDAADAFTIGRNSLPVVFGSTPGSVCLHGTIAVLYLWRRAVTPAEFTALEIDPFQIVTPVPVLPPTQVSLALAGVDIRPRVRQNGSLTIHDALNDAPNTCTLQLQGAPPVAADALRVEVGGPPVLLFSGTVQTEDWFYDTSRTLDGIPPAWVYTLQAVDDLARLNALLPWGTWTNVSASIVVADLLAAFAPGFTGTHVQAGLPAVTMRFDRSQDFSACLKAIATAMGGGHFYAEDLDLHFFQTESTGSPDPIDATHPFCDDPPLTVTRDRSQLRTRVYGKGGGAAVLRDVDLADPVVPIADASFFDPAGGLAVCNGRVFSYTGVQLGGVITALRDPGDPGGPLVPAVSVFGVMPTPRVTGTLRGAGGGIATVVYVSGFYKYGIAYRTANGQTVMAALGGSGTVAQAVTLSGPSYTTVPYTGPGFSPFGYGAGGGPGNPASPGPAFVSPFNGAGYAINYYAWTIVTASGESTTQGTTGLFAQDVVQIGNPTWSDPRILGINHYRNGQFLTLLAVSGDTYDDIGGPTTTQQAPNFDDDASNGTLVVTVPIATDPRVLGRVLYRTAVDGQKFFLLATIDNTVADFLDTIADTELGADPPRFGSVGLSPGDTTLLLTDTTGVVSGWVLAGSQFLRVTVIGPDLTLPATGAGSVQAALSRDTPVTTVAALTGVSGLTTPLVTGDQINLWIQRDDLAAQAVHGLVEYLVSDERRAAPSLTALCDAHLALYSQPIVTVHYATRDTKTKSGKTIVIDLAHPPIHETLTIQDVAISEIDIADGLAPKFSVTASTVRQSLEDVLRTLLLGNTR